MATYGLRKFVAPEFLFGAGARHRVGYYARNLNGRRILVVTDRGVSSAGWLRETLDNLQNEGMCPIVFDDVTPNSKDHEVMAGVDAYWNGACDLIVALGGGSVIDCAKGISIVVANKGHITSYEGIDEVPLPGPPLICIPTTAGTSADISQFAIITAVSKRKKISIVSKTVVPDIALVDPETTTTMDRHLTASTGLDALTHAVEAYVSTASSPVVDVHALAAIKGVHSNIIHAINNPADLAARERMTLASLQAGLAFSNASLGAVHAMAHSVGGYYDLAHGETNALLLEFVADFNFSASPDRYLSIGEALGLHLAGRPESEMKRLIIEELRRLRISAGIEGGLAARGVSYGDIRELAKHAIQDACIYTNPRRASARDIEVIFSEAL